VDALRNRWQLHGLNNGTIFTLTYRGVSRLPAGVSYGIGHVGTWIAYRLMPETTSALVENLRVVRPDLEEAALRRLALSTYRHYARDVIDFIRSLSMSEAEVERLFTWSGRDVYEAVRDGGRGMLLVTAHFGNWEIGAVLLRHIGCPLDVVVMPEADETVNELRRRFRESLGAGTIEIRQSMSTPLQIRDRLAANRAVAMLMDRHVERDRVRVQFFGRAVYFLRAPALLAYLTGAPLVPCFLVRQDDGTYRTTMEEPIEIDRSVDRDTGVQRAAQAFATILERHIRRTPECWYQFYRYWADQEVPADDRVSGGAVSPPPTVKSVSPPPRGRSV
jgi:KDO2-lipid IV(A) lauroyltransferase